MSTPTSEKRPHKGSLKNAGQCYAPDCWCNRVALTSNERAPISAGASELMMELFNRMPVEALKNVPEPIAKRIGDFMVANGYRIVFDRWYLQAEPHAPETREQEPQSKDVGDLLMAITSLRQKAEDAEVLAKHVWDTATAQKASEPQNEGPLKGATGQ